MSTPQHPPLVITFEAAPRGSDGDIAVVSASLVGRSEFEVLCKGLHARGYALKDVIGDGNCLFRSVAYHVFGNEDGYAALRARVVKELRVSGWLGKSWVGN